MGGILLICLTVLIGGLDGETPPAGAGHGNGGVTNVLQAKDPAGWTPLFNGKDLTGWKPYLGMRSKKDTGLVDRNLERIFQVVDGAIHVYRDSPGEATVPEGFLMTDREYSHYHLKLEYRWGTKKFAQRVGKKRNSGLIFHAQDSAGFWPTSIECQVMEGDVGDIYTQNNAWCTTSVDTVIIDPLTRRPVPRYSPSGRTYDHGGAGSKRLMRQAQLDSAEGWNAIEIAVEGDRATFFVNGKMSSKMWNIRHVDPRNPELMRPISRGRILLQAEGAEILFRNIMIKETPPGAKP